MKPQRLLREKVDEYPATLGQLSITISWDRLNVIEAEATELQCKFTAGQLLNQIFL